MPRGLRPLDERHHISACLLLLLLWKREYKGWQVIKSDLSSFGRILAYAGGRRNKFKLSTIESAKYKFVLMHKVLLNVHTGTNGNFVWVDIAVLCWASRNWD